jgi:hypothetical protein
MRTEASKRGPYSSILSRAGVEDALYQQTYGDGENSPVDAEYGNMNNREEIVEVDTIETDAYDKFIGARLSVDLGVEGKRQATVKARARDYDGNFIGRPNANPTRLSTESSMRMEPQTYSLRVQWQKIYMTRLTTNAGSI